MTTSPSMATAARRGVIALAVAALPACLLAPPRPADGAGDAGLTACTIPADARLTASVVMPTAAGDTLVRAGTWSGQRVVNVYPPGPAFDPRCPATTIRIGDDALTVLAITPMSMTSVLVLGQLPDLRWKVVAVPLDPQEITRDAVTTDEAIAGDAAPPFVAYHPAAVENPEVLFGFGRALWVAPGTFGGEPAAKLDIQNSPEDYYAAAPLIPAIGSARWAVVGRRSNLYMYVQSGPPAVLRVEQEQRHTGTPCDPDPTACEERIARVPHVAPRGTDDLVAYSISRSGTGDLTLLQDDGSSTALAMTSLSVEAVLAGAKARDVAMVSLDGVTLQPLVLASPASDLDSTLVLGATVSAAPTGVGQPGPDARVVTGAFRGDGQLRALVLADAPGDPAFAESCWTISSTGLAPCD